jgi:TRAP-type C4-dicarboxylate transport system permease small subunit
MSETQTSNPTGAVGRVLWRLSQISAGIGGVALVCIALMTMYSVIARSLFSKPIQGDFELVQLGCAVCVAAFLPYCQWQRANIIVDFFTVRAAPRTRAWLDALGALLLATATLLAGWRTGVGALAVRDANETSMLMGVPIWMSYAFIAPGLLLTGAVAIYTAYQYLTEGSSSE